MFVGCPMDDFAGFKPNNQNPYVFIKQFINNNY